MAQAMNPYLPSTNMYRMGNQEFLETDYMYTAVTMPLTDRIFASITMSAGQHR